MDKLHYFHETENGASWKEIKGSQEFVNFMVSDLGLKRGDHMAVLNNETVENSTDRVSVVLKAWKDQRSEVGAIQLINVLNEQGSTYLSINPSQEVGADEGEA